MFCVLNIGAEGARRGISHGHDDRGGEMYDCCLRGCLGYGEVIQEISWLHLSLDNRSSHSLLFYTTIKKHDSSSPSLFPPQTSFAVLLPQVKTPSNLPPIVALASVLSIQSKGLDMKVFHALRQERAGR